MLVEKMHRNIKPRGGMQAVRPFLLKLFAAACMLDFVGASPCSDSCTDATPPPFTPGTGQFGAAGLTCEGARESQTFPFESLCQGGLGGQKIWTLPANQFCEQSCADAGFNYADPPCCTSAPPNAPPLFSKTSYTNCGIRNTLSRTPERVVTLNQGPTELMLAMGLEDKMVGTASMDDTIWPRYAEAYNKIPILTASGSWYPTEQQIMAVRPDFIVGAYGSAFAEERYTGATSYSRRGIFSDATVGPCDGENSDFFPAGDASYMTPYSTCRPQLHAAGIGTWLWVDKCEDPALRPVGGATVETVYAAVTQLGQIFDVPNVAKVLNADIRNDFAVAKAALKKAGMPSLKAVWLDSTCGGGEGIFVGGGHGAPNIIMQESGLTNAFADTPGSWYCVSLQDIIDADPDVFVIVDANWDSAVGKLDYLHNHSDYCNLRAVQEAEYIKIQFSASTLGPRNGVAALDMVSAAMHLHTGDAVLNFQSGVDFFEDDFVKDHTANLKCPYAGKKEKFANRVAELEAELEQSKQQCAEDNSLNAAAVLDRLRQGTIKVVFD